MIIPVILSGGSGTRLWPLSRAQHPKQFIGLTADESLFQLTLQRLQGLTPGAAEPMVVCNEEHRFIVAEQCRAQGVKPHSILLEPLGRNTAPAITAAAITAMADGQDPVLLVLAADHVLTDIPAFHAAVLAGLAAAQAGQLVTFGVVPTAPETGYGYIRVDCARGGAQVMPVQRFVEKPDLPTAQRYVADGRHFWNSGMFMFRASALLAEMEHFAPGIVHAMRASVEGASSDLDFVRLHAASFAASPSDSIDYAVMERTDKAMVVPLDAGWSDVGAWSSLWQAMPHDSDGNALRGDVLTHKLSNSLVHAEHRLVAVLGLDDVVVVETADAVLVAHKQQVQDVKHIVEQLKAAARPEVNLHRKVYRPWGNFDALASGERYQVKCITVLPGQRLSTQMHHQRAEHWVVVSGTARVWLGDREILLAENQSTYIPIGVVHTLENPGKIPLELIEVQSGAYLGEDDIVRFDDRYGRAPAKT